MIVKYLVANPVRGLMLAGVTLNVSSLLLAQYTQHLFQN